MDKLVFSPTKLVNAEAAPQKNPISYIIIRNKRDRMFSLFNIKLLVVMLSVDDDDSLSFTISALQACWLRPSREYSK